MHTSEESKGRAKAKHLFLFDPATEFAKFSRRAANRSPFIRRHDVAVLPVPMSVTDQPDHDRNDRCGRPPEGREGNLLPAPLARTAQRRQLREMQLKSACRTRCSSARGTWVIAPFVHTGRERPGAPDVERFLVERITESAWNVSFFCDVGVPGPKRKLTKMRPPNIATFFRKFASCPCSSGPWYAQKSCAARSRGNEKECKKECGEAFVPPDDERNAGDKLQRAPGHDERRHQRGWSAVRGKFVGGSRLVTTPTALQRKMRARVTRPIHSPYRISRSPQFGGDQVRHDGWRPGDVEASNALLDGPITNGDALMLAQVLEPGLDDERFDITPLLCWVLVDRPADSAISVANRLQVPDGVHKGTRVGRIESVFNLDADRSFVRGRDDVEVRLGPVRRRREIERGHRP